MSREQNVPLLLWISTAILAHIATGGGAEQIARVLEDRSELQSFARTIRVRLQPPQALEIAFESLPPAPEEAVEPRRDQADDGIKPEKKKKPETPSKPAAEKKPE